MLFGFSRVHILSSVSPSHPLPIHHTHSFSNLQAQFQPSSGGQLQVQFRITGLPCSRTGEGDDLGNGKEAGARLLLHSPMAKTSSLTRKPAALDKSSKKRKSDASAGSVSTLKSRSASSDSDGISQLFKPYSKDHLIDLITHAALKDPSIYAQITCTADNGVSLRQLFVYGLPWDTTQDSLRSAFQSFGEIENCSLISDKNTGIPRATHLFCLNPDALPPKP